MSYDSLEVLSGFAQKYGITFPLLSDEGSAVIKSLGLLNEEANERVFGIPHPGLFVLDADGRIASKHFYESYRMRDTGAAILAHILGVEPDASPAPLTAEDDGITVRAALDGATYSWGQRRWLTIDIDLPTDLHVYGHPIPDGYYPLEITIAPREEIEAGEPEFPDAIPFRLEGLDEQFYVYEDSVRVSLPITFVRVDAGDFEIDVTVSYQACNTVECFQPKSVHFAFPVEEKGLVERVRPTA